MPPSQIPAGDFLAPGSSKQLALAVTNGLSPKWERHQTLTETQLHLARHTTALFHNARMRHLETRHQTIDRWHGQAPALTPPVEPFVKCPAGSFVKELHSAKVSDQPVIVPRPLKLGLERFHRPAQLLAAVFFDPVGDPLYGCQVLLGSRAPFDPWFALSIRLPVKLESQKIKPPVVRPAIVPEAQRLGLRDSANNNSSFKSLGLNRRGWPQRP